MKKFTWILLFILSVAVSLQAQNDEMAPVTKTLAITNVNIVPAPGQLIENGTVVVKNGVITAVGKNVAVPPGARIIKADSLYLYSGFILGMSHAGIKMPEQKDRPEVKEPANPPDDLAGITPERTVFDFLTANDNSITELRELGFTIAQTAPKGGMLPGNTSIIFLSGNDTDDLILNPGTAIYATLDGARRMYPATVMGVMSKFRELYRQAELAKNFQQQYAANPEGMIRPDFDRTVVAFYPVIEKKVPVVFEGSDVLDIQRILTLQKELGFNLTLSGVQEGWDIVDRLKRNNIDVLFSLDLPEWKEDSVKVDSTATVSEETKRLKARKKEFAKKHFSQMATFQNAGVPFGFSTVDTKAKDIHKNILTMIDNGLSERAALSALTTTPASMLGISKFAGTVENGKMANFVISKKPYFQKGSKVKYVVVEGKLYEYELKEKAKAGPEAIANAVGSWSYSSESPQGTVTGNLVISETDGILSGTITNSATNETSKLNDVVLTGNKLSFNFSIEVSGDYLEIEGIVTIAGDTFDGTMSISNEAFAVEGKKDPKN